MFSEGLKEVLQTLQTRVEGEGVCMWIDGRLDGQRGGVKGQRGDRM